MALSILPSRLRRAALATAHSTVLMKCSKLPEVGKTSVWIRELHLVRHLRMP